MRVEAIRTRVFRESEDLALFVLEHVPALKEGSILVVTSKIAALAEGRTARVIDKERTIRAESDYALKTPHVWLTLKSGMVLANAGVDESNARGKLILLPKDSFSVAAKLRAFLRKRWKLKKLGVLITDSRLLPLRAGSVGVALGYAGFKGVRDYRGKKDIFGRILKMSRVDVADSLATAAVLEMGEGAEQMPLAVIGNAPVEFRETLDRKELHIDVKKDLYRPLFMHLPKKKR